MRGELRLLLLRDLEIKESWSFWQRKHATWTALTAASNSLQYSSCSEVRPNILWSSSIIGEEKLWSNFDTKAMWLGRVLRDLLWRDMKQEFAVSMWLCVQFSLLLTNPKILGIFAPKVEQYKGMSSTPLHPFLIWFVIG